MSSQTQGRDLEDMWSLDMVPDVRHWWNCHKHFWWMFPPIWHHLQFHQEFQYPPRLQEETWRTCGVLTWLLISDLDETFKDTSDGCSLPSATISKSIRNVHVLLESRKRLGGQEKSDVRTSSQTIRLTVESKCCITKLVSPKSAFLGSPCT